eukprot:2497318-Pyramimonas_sp.AAC.1
MADFALSVVRRGCQVRGPVLSDHEPLRVVLREVVSQVSCPERDGARPVTQAGMAPGKAGVLCVY